MIKSEEYNISLEALGIIHKSQIQFMEVPDIEEQQKEEESSAYGDETDDELLFDKAKLTKDMVKD